MYLNDKALIILLVSPLPPPAGGIATWTKKYLEWSRKNNIIVEIVNTAVTGERAEQINASRNFLDEIKRTVAILKDIKKKIRLKNPNLVHLNSPCGKFGIIRDYFCASLIKRYKIPLVVHYRCNIKDQIKNRVIQKFFFCKLSKLANINLVLNTPSKEYLKAVSGQDGILVDNFIDEEFILKEKKRIKMKIENIVFTGHVQITKGIKEIIEAASHFPQISFILAGPVSNEIKSLKASNNVIFKGPVNLSHVKDLLNKADVFLFPTYTEGFSNALLEAMAMGLPVITTPVGANADMIESSGGILVREKKYEDIIEAITKLEDQKYREKVSVWNVKKVEDNYVIDSVMLQLISIYKLLDKTIY